MSYTYKTKSIEERLWLINMAIDHGLIRDGIMVEMLEDIETEDDWESFPYCVYYPNDSWFDLRCVSSTEVTLDEFLELTNMISKSGFITKRIKKHVL